LLGKNTTISLPTDGVLFMYSGVNLEPRGDTVSRSVLIRLDPAIERPWAKQWETRDPTEIALEMRGELVSAALTVLKAFIIAGCPDQGCGPFRLAGWNRVIRNAVLWAGYADPLAGMTQLEDGDPENEPCADLMAAWSRVFGERSVTAAEVVAVSDANNDDLKHALLAVAASGRAAGVIEPRRLGRFLSRYHRKVVGGLRFVRTGESGSRARWALQLAESARSFAVSAVLSTPHHADAGRENDSPNHTTHTARACARDIEQGAANCKNCETAPTADPGRDDAPGNAGEDATTADSESEWTDRDDGGSQGASATGDGREDDELGLIA
jgi:hypothetical protein